MLNSWYRPDWLPSVELLVRKGQKLQAVKLFKEKEDLLYELGKVIDKKKLENVKKVLKELHDFIYVSKFLQKMKK